MSNLHVVNNKLLKGVNLKDKDFQIEVVEVINEVIEECYNFLENDLHNSDTDLDWISSDLNKISSYISRIGMAKTVAKTVLEGFLSITDEKWRTENLNDYKQSSKSSTIHLHNLKGLPEVMPWSQASGLLETLYYDLNRKFEALRSIASNRKFEIEKGLIEYTIRKKIDK